MHQTSNPTTQLLLGQFTQLRNKLNDIDRLHQSCLKSLLAVNRTPFFKVINKTTHPLVIYSRDSQVRAIDRDHGENGTVRYSLGTITAYEPTKHKMEVQFCDEPRSQEPSSTVSDSLNLLDYFQIDPESGVCSLKSPIPEQLIDLSCRITIFARDCASFPMESVIHMCVTITDRISGSNSFNRTGTASGSSMRLQARRSRATFYLYVVVALSIVGLLASVAFVLSAYFLWHRPRSKTTGNRTNVIHFDEVNNMTTGANIEKVECPEPIYGRSVNIHDSKLFYLIIYNLNHSLKMYTTVVTRTCILTVIKFRFARSLQTTT